MKADLVASVHFTEPEELIHAVPGVSLRATPTCPGSFSAAAITLRLNGLVFQAGTCAPAIIMGQATPGSSVVHLPYAGTETFILNGRAMAPGLVALYGGGAVLERVSRQTTCHAALILPMEEAESLLAPSSTSPLLRPAGHAMMQTHRPPWLRVIRLAEAVAKTIESDAATFLEPEARRSLRASLVNAFGEMISGDEESGAPRQMRISPARKRIVNVVDDYLVVNTSRPIYTEDLCSVLKISPARLADAFRTSFGVTPHRFLKLRRLAMVRAALRGPEGPVPLVRSVAHAHGFWHLGQFARDYRAMYGETPSETLARSRGLPAHGLQDAGPEGECAFGAASPRRA